MTRSQQFAGAVLAGVLVGIVLQPSLGRVSAIVIAVAVAAAVDAGGRRLRGRRERERTDEVDRDRDHHPRQK